MVIKKLGTQCLCCGKKLPILGWGFVKSVFESPMAGDWIMRPELSKAHLGEADRDLEFEQKQQMQPHIVYLAQSSNVKVGVTRKQVPTRWIDQGANQALPILEVPNRYLAGITEVALKEVMSDKTQWRKMLQQFELVDDLTEWREKVKDLIPEEAKDGFLSNEQPLDLVFRMSLLLKKLQVSIWRKNQSLKACSKESKHNI